jgi:hypothetical protein
LVFGLGLHALRVTAGGPGARSIGDKPAKNPPRLMRGRRRRTPRVVWSTGLPTQTHFAPCRGDMGKPMRVAASRMRVSLLHKGHDLRTTLV